MTEDDVRRIVREEQMKFSSGFRRAILAEVGEFVRRLADDLESEDPAPSVIVALAGPAGGSMKSADEGWSLDRVKVRVLPDGRLSRADAARFLGLAVGTLSNWDSRGEGPRSVTVGGRIFYYLRDLEAFRDTGTRQAP